MNNSTCQTLKTLLTRDLAKLRDEINLYTNEIAIWKIQDGIANSAGNLCLHLVGNLNTYIGAELGRSGYMRDRDAEFSLKNIPREELVKMIGETIRVVGTTLDGLNDDDLEKEYPALVFKEKTSTKYFLIHLAVHLGYHLGQVNYHRRLLDK